MPTITTLDALLTPAVPDSIRADHYLRSQREDLERLEGFDLDRVGELIGLRRNNDRHIQAMDGERVRFPIEDDYYFRARLQREIERALVPMGIPFDDHYGNPYWYRTQERYAQQTQPILFKCAGDAPLPEPKSSWERLGTIELVDAPARAMSMNAAHLGRVL